MYSVHYPDPDTPFGSPKYACITFNHDHSPEVKAKGEIHKRFKRSKFLPETAQVEGPLELCYVEEFQHSTVIRRSIGLGFRERPGSSDSPHDVSDLPVRLIDIQDTLNVSAEGGVCFIQPTDWSFHTLSHTWSKGLRDLSERIGKKGNSEQDYNKAFRGAELHKLEGEAGACYHRLMEFLMLLKEEGVKAIWFDALCINQADTTEKDREISRMGAYYGCSSGCYVLAHGIGQGFKLWSLQAGDFPRWWFSRVWTIQEFLLSKKVTFIVEGLEKKTIGCLNHYIRKGGKEGVPGFCKCALPRGDG